MQNVMQGIGLFIGAAIILAIGIQILGNSLQDCTTLPDYVLANDDNGVTPDHNQTGWSGQCFSNQETSQNGYQLLGIALIVIAAVIILSIVKFLA